MSIQLHEELSRLLGDRFTTSDHERQQHGKDESSLSPMPPDAVCFPLSTEEVSAIVRLCRQTRTPVIPFGAGSSLEGHIFAPQGGVSVVEPAGRNGLLEQLVKLSYYLTKPRETAGFAAADSGNFFKGWHGIGSSKKRGNKRRDHPHVGC